MKKYWAYLIGIPYFCLLIYLLFLAPFREATETSINLVPLKSVIKFCKEFYWPHWWYWVLNIPGNIVAFVPVPIFLSEIFRYKFSWTQLIILALIIPVSIEVMQYLFSVGSSNIDDVILNFTGFCIGFWILRRHQAKHSPAKSQQGKP